MSSESKYPFYFAIPRAASRASRAKAPQHVADHYGVRGPIEHVRSEGWFHLYRVADPNP